MVYKHRSKQDASFEVSQIIEWINLTKEDFILDLCCGTGRHTLNFANQGYNIMGMDLSEVLLSYAVHERDNHGVPFIHGDMRHLPFVANSFDVVLNLFTSFGYFQCDGDNQKVLTEMARVLKPNGRFFIDYLNRDAVIDNLVPESSRQEGETYIKEKRRIEGNSVIKDITIVDHKGQREYLEHVKMYTIDQMKEMLDKAGLTIEHAFGNFSGASYSVDSERMIMMGSKQTR
nr:class I SAM-dependent methyltransferase [Polycladospora coralii]